MDGYVYRLEYTERVTEDSGMVRVDAKAWEFADTTEQAVRDNVAELLASADVSNIMLRRRLPTPEWEPVVL